jgi:hypothetical protein
MEDLLTMVQAADVFDKSQYFIYAMIRENKIKRYEVDGMICVSRSELGDYINSFKSKKHSVRKRTGLVAIQDWNSLVQDRDLDLVSEDQFLKYCWDRGLNCGSKREDLDKAFAEWKANA